MKKFITAFSLFFVLSVIFAQTVPVLPIEKDTNAEELLLVVPTGVSIENSCNLLETWGYDRTPSSEVEFSNITIFLFKNVDSRSCKTVKDAVMSFNTMSRDGSYLVPNIKMYAFDIPTDPCFNRADSYKDKEGVAHDILLQWDLKNGGQFGGIAGADLKATEAWSELTGELTPVIVAVIDTGVDTKHPNLAARIYKKDGQIIGTSFVSGTTYEDDHGHGTHCAGSIAGIINDGEGTAGVAGKTPVFIMPIKALSKEGSGGLQQITDAMKWAGKNGATVISMSLGAVAEGWQEALVKMLFDQALSSAELKNVVCVAAAGNDGKDVHAYPAYCDNVIAIAAFSNLDQLATFSNFGQWVDVASPGVNIVSARAFFNGVGLDMYRSAGYDKCDFTIGSSPNEAYENRKYYIASGTSMACPNAVGVVAMMKAVKPALTTTQIAKILIDTSDKKEVYTQKIKGGRINALNAVKAAKATN